MVEDRQREVTTMLPEKCGLGELPVAAVGRAGPSGLCKNGIEEHLESFHAATPIPRHDGDDVLLPKFLEQFTIEVDVADRSLQRILVTRGKDEALLFRP